MINALLCKSKAMIMIFKYTLNRAISMISKKLMKVTASSAYQSLCTEKVAKQKGGL